MVGSCLKVERSQEDLIAGTELLEAIGARFTSFWISVGGIGLGEVVVASGKLAHRRFQLLGDGKRVSRSSTTDPNPSC